MQWDASSGWRNSEGMGILPRQLVVSPTMNCAGPRYAPYCCTCKTKAAPPKMYNARRAARAPGVVRGQEQIMRGAQKRMAVMAGVTATIVVNIPGDRLAATAADLGLAQQAGVPHRGLCCFFMSPSFLTPNWVESSGCRCCRR